MDKNPNTEKEILQVIKLNQKEFTQKSDEILRNMGTEELRRCLDNITRKVPENKREMFLQLLDNCRDLGHNEDGNNLHKRCISDEKVKETLTSINDAFTKVENGDLYISANGYEDYSNGYWASDWIWEYEDNDGVGRIIEDAVLFAHDCMNDCRYEEALTVFKLIMDTQVSVVDEDGGDSSDLDLDELVDEKIAGINLGVFALDVLYAEYQLQPKDQRAVSLYSYFSYPYFSEIHIEDIFSIGTEEAKDADIFWKSWIDLLMKQSGKVAARLLKEAILHHKGIAGMLEMARIGYKEHPSLFLAALLECEKAHDYKEMKEIGMEALEKLGHDLKIRGEIAIKTAQASYCVNDGELMRKCWYEAFHSNSTVVNYLRLFIDIEATKPYKDFAIERIGKLHISDGAGGHYDRGMGTETAENSVSGTDFKYLCFFSGHFDKVRNWCMEQKNPLGWSGGFIGYGINLLLLYLYADSNLRKAGKVIATRVSNSIGFNESKNLVFMKENSAFEAEVIAQKGEETFWNTFCSWKAYFEMPMDERKSYIDWLESVIDKRINAIIGGKYRNKYGDVALLAAALGEVEESLGMKSSQSIINGYLEKYSRYSSFRGALKEYV